MNKKYTVTYSPKASRQLYELDPSIQRLIIKRIETQLSGSENPKLLCSPLTGKLSIKWRYRVRDCSVLCDILDDKLLIYIIAVRHRREVYD